MRVFSCIPVLISLSDNQKKKKILKKIHSQSLNDNDVIKLYKEIT